MFHFFFFVDWNIGFSRVFVGALVVIVLHHHLCKQPPGVTLVIR